MKDRIMRRARDHLLTASYMGLLSRIGRPFGYWSTTVGKQLRAHIGDEECPKDAKEEAVFIDRIMRLKLTNVYDLQQRKQYTRLRSRPCLYILHILKTKKWLHEHQIAVATGTERCDPLLADGKTKRTLKKICKYAGLSKNLLLKFYKDYAIDEETKRNMTRNVRPLLDWCEALGLIISKELQGIGGRWYNLTDRGVRILSVYKNKIPIWYIDLGEGAPLKAAIILFYRFLRARNLAAGSKLLNLSLQTGLVKTRIKKTISELVKEQNILFSNDFTVLESEIDFTFEYNVPPEEASMVKSLLRRIGQVYGVKFTEILNTIELDAIDELRFSIQKQHEEIKRKEVEKFASRTPKVSKPILTKISSIMPSTGILNQYRSDFEKEAALLLRILDFNANKYQGQMADRCTKTYAIRFFENNPDILITNGVEVLVECKSIGEWKGPLSDKRVPKEITIYERLFDEVKPSSVLIVYEGTLDAKSLGLVASILEDNPHVIFVTKNYLVNCIYRLALKRRLIQMLKTPKKFETSFRVLR